MSKMIELLNWWKKKYRWAQQEKSSCTRSRRATHCRCIAEAVDVGRELSQISPQRVDLRLQIIQVDPRDAGVWVDAGRRNERRSFRPKKSSLPRQTFFFFSRLGVRNSMCEVRVCFRKKSIHSVRSQTCNWTRSSLLDRFTPHYWWCTLQSMCVATRVAANSLALH